MYRVSPKAEADLREISSFISNNGDHEEFASVFTDSIIDRFPLLQRFPHMGRSRDADLGTSMRSLAVGNYLILYCIEGPDILILRVVHSRRNLGALFKDS